MPCKTCGIHFPEDFEETLEPKCSFWKRLGLDKLSDEDKKDLWDWLFAYDFDDLFVRTGIVVGVSLQRNYRVVRWEESFPGYPDLSEQEQRDFQNFYYRVNRLPTWGFKLWWWYARVRLFAFRMGLYRREALWMRALRRRSSAG